jgi:hypothetical protein
MRRYFRENLPTFMCVVQAPILDDAQEGSRGWLEKASPRKMAVEELPLGFPTETFTAYRDRRR